MKAFPDWSGDVGELIMLHAMENDNYSPIRTELNIGLKNKIVIDL